MKVSFTFHGFSDYEDGKMAHLTTATGPDQIPVNIFIDNAAEYADLQRGPCQIDVYGIGSEIKTYSSKEGYKASGTNMAETSMIPVGTFGMDDSFVPSPHIFFSGIVRSAACDPNAAKEDANYLLAVESYCIAFELYIRSEREVKTGDIVHGIAWLFGDIV